MIDGESLLSQIASVCDTNKMALKDIPSLSADLMRDMIS